jgi:pimeloyl-ACP methyl ester carboxylesterase
MVIGSTADAYTPPDETRALAAAARGRAALWLVEGRDHAAMVVAADEAWRQRVGAFLAQHLRDAPAQ